jgi:hypothetical protein
MSYDFLLITVLKPHPCAKNINRSSLNIKKSHYMAFHDAVFSLYDKNRLFEHISQEVGLHLADKMSAQQVLIMSSHCVLRYNSKLNPSLYPNNKRCASSKVRDSLKY